MTRRFCVLLALAAGLACDNPAAPSASIHVTVSTNGKDLDEDGYEIVVDGGKPIKVGTFADVLVPGIKHGDHVVELNGIAGNCVPAAGQAQSVTVGSGETPKVDFALVCEGTGLDVTIRTSGSDFPFGFHLQIADHATYAIGAGETIYVGRLEARSYALSLTGLASNCVLAGGLPASVNVPARVIVPVVVDVVCARTEKRIAFVLDTLVGGRVVNWILTSDDKGANVVPIARGRDPSWAPDGRILFSSAVCEYYYGTCDGGLEIIDPDTRAHEVLALGRGGVNPSWSPDGGTIAFSKVAFVTTLHTWRQNAAPLPVEGHLRGLHPSWSHDGERIAYTCEGPNGNGRLCTVRRDGAGFFALTPDPRTWAFFAKPRWSPTGNRIAFETNSFNGFTDVALVAPDGTAITRVTNGENPSWSPDGSRLVFARDNGLYAIAPDGSNESRLTTGRHRSPVWR